MSILLARYPYNQSSTKAFWITVSLLLYLAMWHGRLWPWRTVVLLAAIGIVFFGESALTASSASESFLRVALYAAELALLLVPSVRRWVARAHVGVQE